MMRSTDEAGYLQDVCRIVVEECGHAMVWIGYAQEDEEKSIKPAACFGIEFGALETLKFSWADSEQGRCPTGTTIQTGKPAVCRNILTDPAPEPWRQDAIKNGYASMVAFPLIAEERAFGAMTIYSKESDGFTESEIRLLAELSADLSHGISALRLRAARNALEGQLRFQANALAQVADAIIMVDDDYNVQYMNSAAASLYHVTPGTVKMLSEIYTPKWLDPGDEEKSLDDLDMRGAWSGENIHVRPTGEELWVHSNVAVVKDKDGNRIGLLAVIRDISELAANRRKIEQLNVFLNQKATDLTLANKELEAFSYSVSHDLRNPLHGIVSCVEALKVSPTALDGDTREAIDHIERSAYRMSQVITDLLSLSRITQQELKRDVVDLTPIATSFFEELRRTNPARNARLEMKPGLAAMADVGLVSILLENLIRNAWKFTAHKPEARIEIGITDSIDPPAFFVRDNGAGFDMKLAERLFVPFKRLHTEKEFTGTGIGLATVKRIVDKHGGAVWAEGIVGEGATFYFRLS
jgi:PAS domain S-box-containing protein